MDGQILGMAASKGLRTEGIERGRSAKGYTPTCRNVGSSLNTSKHRVLAGNKGQHQRECRDR